MARTIFSFFLICYTLVCFGQNNSVPLSIQVPGSSRQIRHTYAKGVQIYICTQDMKDTSRYGWTFTEPRANLYADNSYHQLVGKHHLDHGKNPTWEYNDGSSVSGVKVQQANSPDSLAIPWLLLKVAGTSGTGTLTPVTFIQRIRTKGGKAPAMANKSQKGQSLEVPYTAEYIFHSDK